MLGVWTTKENGTYACLFVVRFYDLVNTFHVSVSEPTYTVQGQISLMVIN